MSGIPLAETAPRYTSYPTAPHFHAGVGDAQARGWLADVREDESLSLYLHIPFCDKLCWFCACHTRHTLRYEPVARYLDALIAEIELVARILDGRGIVQAVHFGGGSPTMLRPTDLKRVDRAVRSAFRIAPGMSLAVEIDPSDMDEARLDTLAEIGMTRASLGVQDFDPVVQAAINRHQSEALTASVVAGLRCRGIGGINLDLVYGLPHQTEEGLTATVSQCLDMDPQRIALFGYAHVPWFKKHQTMIDEAALPGPAARLAQAQAAAARIAGAGYTAVGIDHFAAPGDSLARARDDGTLRRNFQGYTDDGCETLIGLGPSAVSRFRDGYAQNVSAMGAYVRAVGDGRLPIVRGVALSAEDRVRGWVIERLMCDFGFSTSDLVALDPAIGDDVAREAERISTGGDGSLVRRGDRYEVREGCRLLVRSIAARFDAYLEMGAARHSATV